MPRGEGNGFSTLMQRKVKPARSELKIQPTLIPEELLSDQVEVVGEYLREKIFIESASGKFGCYDSFEVDKRSKKMTENERLAFSQFIFCSEVEGTLVGLTKEDAKEFTEELRGTKGYVLEEKGLRYETAWHWDGDGWLCFRVFKDDQFICGVSSNDCKKTSRWHRFNIKEPLDKFKLLP